MSKGRKPRINDTTCSIMTWLNGRAVGPIVILHAGMAHTVWTIEDGRAGTTIEDAIDRFVRTRGIDWQREIKP